MKISALKSMMMAAAITVATCVTVNAAAMPAQMTQDSTKKGKMGKGKMGKMKKAKKDTTTKM